jgi:glycosyltransferase involved in cell wall biosynthesis
MQRWGGVSHCFCRIANALKEIDWDIRVFAGFHGNRHLSGVPDVPLTGIRIGRSKNLWRSQLALSRYWMRMGGAARGRLIQDTYYHSAYRRIFPDAPYVITVQDMIGDLFPDDSGWSDRARARRHASIRLADVIVTPSQATASDLIRLCDVDPGRVFVAPLGVESLIPQDWVPPAWPFILNVGSRKRYKDFGTARAAIAKIRAGGSDIGLVCFGDAITGEEYAALEQSGIPRDRIIHESGPDEMLASIYRSAALMVYQSTYEGFGMPILEAMANDCPVVCSDTPACVEAAGSAALVAKRGDADDFAAKMLSLLEDPAIREKMVDLGRDRATTQTWESTARCYARAYEAAWEFFMARNKKAEG